MKNRKIFCKSGPRSCIAGAVVNCCVSLLKIHEVMKVHVGLLAYSRLCVYVPMEYICYHPFWVAR